MLLSLLLSTALAQQVVYQDTIQGGVAADTSGVSTVYTVNQWYSGDSFEVRVPTGSTVERIFAVVRAR